MWHDHTLLWAGCVCVCACLSGKRLKRRKTLEPGILYNDINLIYHIASGVETPAFFPPPTKLATYGENISSGRRADVPAGRRWGTWALIRRSGWPPSSHRYNISLLFYIDIFLFLWTHTHTIYIYIYICIYVYVCTFVYNTDSFSFSIPHLWSHVFLRIRFHHRSLKCSILFWCVCLRAPKKRVCNLSRNFAQAISTHMFTKT